MTTDWPEYLAQITNGDTLTEISKRTGANIASVHRWLHGKTNPTHTQIAAVCRAYNVSPAAAFVTLGVLEEADLDPGFWTQDAPVRLADFDTDVLLRELGRRVQPRPEPKPKGHARPKVKTLPDYSETDLTKEMMRRARERENANS
ncbi:helix-turn-helix domain-containing protein [Leifsonia sp. Leaf264]|uniref:helix-turn-helix domain-containing protein n=1 Tax=Leifsonia sp. Leaf264 TaxID=1736314 RepID=UPI0006F84B65|nr:helix-turn-helix transcriptional regulator [Leifsonia sp. Leaf264]KQO98534.1 hypothetical protein ASF30_10760 [Leifsonia sp. Leaf264]